MIRFLLHIILLLWSFTSYCQDGTVHFEVKVNTGDATTGIDVFRCYLSNFQLKFANNDIYFIPDSYHLVDLDEAGTMVFSFSEIPPGEITEVSFLVGTDSLINVSGAFDGDLDPIHGMYWTWNSGYINIKLEGKKISSGQKQAYEFHIGGYSGDQATARRIDLTVGDNAKPILIHMDLAAFLNSVDLTTMNAVMSPGHNAVDLADKFAKYIR